MPRKGKKTVLVGSRNKSKPFATHGPDGIHTYLSYLRDRLIVARELLADSGSIFLQMGTENAPLARLLLAEVFRSENHICDLIVQKTGNQTGEFIQANADVLVWFARDKKAAKAKFRKAFIGRPSKPSKETSKESTLDRDDWSANPLTSDGFRETTTVDFWFEQNRFHPGQIITGRLLRTNWLE
jgi:adenine-specific DNA-methyltransferase